MITGRDLIWTAVVVCGIICATYVAITPGSQILAAILGGVLIGSGGMRLFASSRR